MSESWHDYGFGICTSNLKEEISLPGLMELISQAPELKERVNTFMNNECGGAFKDSYDILTSYVGGHDNWTYKLKNKFKNWKFYRPEVTRTIDEKSLQTADYIYFFTDIMSHGSYCRYIKFVREYGLKFGYLHTINIESNINQIYEDIQNLEK